MLTFAVEQDKTYERILYHGHYPGAIRITTITRQTTDDDQWKKPYSAGLRTCSAGPAN